ncbi:seizure protein 6 homolog [Petromyzon marinus]|uniref:seizure protein 6 homolog n=1 Tax=Petromyzon marinus TaxID=7757 RepID=UPI003F70D043
MKRFENNLHRRTVRDDALEMASSSSGLTLDNDHDDDGDFVLFKGFKRSRRGTFALIAAVFCLAAGTSVSRAQAQCGGNFTDSNGIIETPNFPGLYPPMLNCLWIIQSSDRRGVVIISVIDFELEESDACVFDKLRMEAGNPPGPPRLYCGGDFERRYGVSEMQATGRMTLQFNSDESVELRGFRIGFWVEDPLQTSPLPTTTLATTSTTPATTPGQCQPLENMDNGRLFVTSYEVGGVASYTCRPGFRMVGASNRVCEASGRWSGSVPVCRARPTTATTTIRAETSSASELPTNASKGGNASLGCPEPGLPLGGLGPLPGLSLNFRAGDVLRFSCLPGFAITGATSLKCLDSGRWSDEAPTCSRVGMSLSPLWASALIAAGCVAGGAVVLLVSFALARRSRKVASDDHPKMTL